MTYRVMSERNIVDDDDKKSLKINNKISTHSFTAGSFDGTTRWIAFYFRLNMNETEELKKPKSEFVWFTFFVSYLFLFSWRQKKKTTLCSFTFNEIHKSHSSSMHVSFVNASAEVKEKNEYTSKSAISPSSEQQCWIVYLFCNNHKLYKILLTRWTVTWFFFLPLLSGCT